MKKFTVLFSILAFFAGLVFTGSVSATTIWEKLYANDEDGDMLSLCGSGGTSACSLDDLIAAVNAGRDIKVVTQEAEGSAFRYSWIAKYVVVRGTGTGKGVYLIGEGNNSEYDSGSGGITLTEDLRTTVLIKTLGNFEWLTYAVDGSTSTLTNSNIYRMEWFAN